MRELSSQINKSLKVASSTVRFGGRTVKVCGNTIRKTIHAPAEAKKNIKLLKVKFRSLQKATAKGKLKKAVGVVGKTAVKGGKAAVKGVKSGAIGGARFAANSADRLVDSIDNDTVRFAKQSADAAKAAASAAKKAGKVAGKTINKTSKAVRTLATKKGRRKLAKSVKRKINNVKRNVRRAKKVAKVTAKVVKATAKIVSKIVTKIVSLIVETLPYSLIVIGVIIAVILISYLVTYTFTSVLGSQDGVAGWAIDESDDTTEDVHLNIEELAGYLKTGCENKFTKELKDEISNFCVSVSEPQRIIEYTIGDSSATLFPAAGKDAEINAIIDRVINDFSKYTATEYSNFMAALVVLTARKNYGNESFAFEKFTQSEIEEFIGGLNSNSCSFGNTFFVKTTATTSDETCPGAACKRKTEPGCKCAVDDNGNEYCAGHPYCDNDHEKLTIKFQTADKYYGKTVSEIYGFNEEEAVYFSSVSEFIRTMLMEMERGDSR